MKHPERLLRSVEIPSHPLLRQRQSGSSEEIDAMLNLAVSSLDCERAILPLNGK